MRRLRIRNDSNILNEGENSTHSCPCDFKALIVSCTALTFAGEDCSIASFPSKIKMMLHAISTEQLAGEIVPEFELAGQFDRTERQGNIFVGIILFAKYDAAKQFAVLD